MGRPTKSSVKHFKAGPNGEVLCWRPDCGAQADRWVDWTHHGCPRFVSTATCADHGTAGEDETVRLIKQR